MSPIIMLITFAIYGICVFTKDEISKLNFGIAWFMLMVEYLDNWITTLTP